MNAKILQRGAIAAGIVLAVMLFNVFELERYLSLAYLKSSRETLTALYAEHRLAV